MKEPESYGSMHKWTDGYGYGAIFNPSKSELQGIHESHKFLSTFGDDGKVLGRENFAVLWGRSTFAPGTHNLSNQDSSAVEPGMQAGSHLAPGARLPMSPLRNISTSPGRRSRVPAGRSNRNDLAQASQENPQRSTTSEDFQRNGTTEVAASRGMSTSRLQSPIVRSARTAQSSRREISTALSSPATAKFGRDLQADLKPSMDRGTARERSVPTTPLNFVETSGKVARSHAHMFDPAVPASGAHIDSLKESQGPEMWASSNDWAVVENQPGQRNTTLKPKMQTNASNLHARTRVDNDSHSNQRMYGEDRSAILFPPSPAKEQRTAVEGPHSEVDLETFLQFTKGASIFPKNIKYDLMTASQKFSGTQSDDLVKMHPVKSNEMAHIKTFGWSRALRGQKF